MSDDLDALLARADNYDANFWPSQLVTDLAAAVRALQADHAAALDVIAAVRNWQAAEDGAPKLNAYWALEAGSPRQLRA